MAINYASKYAGIVDEKFKLGAMTGQAVNSDYDFIGAKTVSVYEVPTVALQDYKRTGSDRYGTPAELENTKQELTLNMDRSFSFSIDRGNYEDTQMSNAAGQALNRQIEEVVIPEIDKYRLAKMFAGAGTIDTEAIGGYYEEILKASEAVSEANTPLTGRVLFVKTAFFNKLKLDSAFIKASDAAQDMLMKGSIGMIDGMNVFVLPSAYMPMGCDFIVAHAKATTAPTKLAEYKIHKDPPGINGWLVEGRVYFDAFVLNAKKGSIYAKQSAIGSFKVTSAKGSASGKSRFTLQGIDEAVIRAGMKLVYKATETAPTLGSDISAWTEAPMPNGGSFEMEIANGTKITFALAHEGKAHAASEVVTVIA